MSAEELKENINRIARKIMDIEEVSKKKEDYIKNKIYEEYDSKINEIDSKLHIEQNKLSELKQKIDFLNSEKKKLIPIVQNLEKEYRNLKVKKEKALNTQIKAITNEKKTKMKPINREIKLLEKELKKSEKM